MNEDDLIQRKRGQIVGLIHWRCLSILAVLLLLASTAYAFAVSGAIMDKWKALGGEGGVLGGLRSDEGSAQFGGQFARFAYGFIYSHPETGVHGVWGKIGEKWAQFNFEDFGFPITDETGTPDGKGRYNHFRQVNLPGKPETSIYWTGETGAYVIYGAIRAKWAELGWERFGYPITDELATPDGVGRFNHFRLINTPEKWESSIYWTPQTGPVPIYGAIRLKWAETGWERGPFGYPTGPEYQEYNGSPIRRQDFQRGSIWWSPSTGAQTHPIATGSAPPSPSPVPAASAPVISVSVAQNKTFGVTGQGFLPNKTVHIRVADDAFHNIFYTTTSNNSGAINYPVQIPCNPGVLHFSANDERTNRSDLTGTLWSNTVNVSCQ
ncbi:hypothetical protein [Nitrospirillum sp. BR 11163]|uniref:LGFP repeat-containing protein n=1 Tax=Nitrospirillum sp. BR 11163 TaxID=3104323 RepID=UPI002AFEC975|nr:hypothetical protein [Nitrospirillum sp. BR 11163]MEA1675107.1 hypothetical protein [Nitrospirillum sp. BR 11163]